MTSEDTNVALHQSTLDLMAVCLLACVVATRRAPRVEPTQALMEG